MKFFSCCVTTQPNKESTLKNIDGKSLKVFDFDGIETVCKVVSVYDGDTCKVAFYYPEDTTRIIKVNVRLYGIDTPEIRTKDINEKKKAIEAKIYLIILLSNRASIKAR